jgi:ribonuclease PH
MGRSPARTGRGPLEPRPLTLETGAAELAEGSCLVTAGRTRVLCAATLQDGVPEWRRGQGVGWLTAEYAMLPRATHRRTPRERGQLGGRTQEIQRLIGRSLRACVDLAALGERTLLVDCDVLVADGGTRTAAITGAAVAVHQACIGLVRAGTLALSPMRDWVAAISVGVCDGEVRVDLDYAEDVAADVDLNLVALEGDRIVEVQGTAERGTFERHTLDLILDAGLASIRRIVAAQQAAVA